LLERQRYTKVRKGEKRTNKILEMNPQQRLWNGGWERPGTTHVTGEDASHQGWSNVIGKVDHQTKEDRVLITPTRRTTGQLGDWIKTLRETFTERKKGMGKAHGTRA